MEVAKQIQKIMSAMAKPRQQLESRGNEKAQAIAEYDKTIAITLLRLISGETMELDGKAVKKPPATLAKEIAKGICWRERLELERATNAYKSCLTNLETLQAQLNGWQSIFRHLDEA